MDFNNAPEQRSFEVIPAGEICNLQMKIRPGKGGDGGWLKPSKTGECEMLDCEFVVVDGKYANRKFWQQFVIRGNTAKHALAGDISIGVLRAILESARSIKPKDTSEAAQAARHTNGWEDFHGLRFVAQIGVRPAQGEFAAKNEIKQVITPDRQCWKQVEQVSVQPSNGIAPNAASNGGGIAPMANGGAMATPPPNSPPANGGAAATPTPSAPPANAVSRPAWMD